jgi:hypothetical protein
MPRIDVQVPTRDGVSKGTLHVPEGKARGRACSSFAVADMPVHDAALEERHWDALRTLYAEQLG